MKWKFENSLVSLEYTRNGVFVCGIEYRSQKFMFHADAFYKRAMYNKLYNARICNQFNDSLRIISALILF